MDTSKIIRGVVSNGRYTVTAPIVKEDYGLYLQIEGVELPETYQVDFSNSENNGTSVTMIGNADGVLIPHQFISTGKDVFAFLYWVGADYGKTVYKFRIPNKVRPDRTNEQPTPEEQSVIDQTIAALNDAVERAEDAQEAIENMSVSAQTLAEGESATVTKTEHDGVVHLTFGIPKGATGDTPNITASKVGDTTYIYADGVEIAQVEDGTDGTDGVSPTVTITPITGGHRITITDADGTETADVMDGDDYTLTAQDKQDIAELVDMSEIQEDVSDLKEGFSDLEGEFSKTPSVKNVTENDAELYICDANGKVLAKFAEGGFQTEKFNTSDLPDLSDLSDMAFKKNTTTSADLDITDAEGGVVLRLADGHIKTKNFDSADLASVINGISKNTDTLDDVVNYSLDNRLANPIYTTNELYNEENPSNPITPVNALYRNMDSFATNGYRIPTIVITNSGTVLVAAQHMKSAGGDFGDFGIHVARKTVDGEWTASEVIPFDTTRQDYGGCLNPEFLVDRTSERIYLFYGTEKQKVVWWEVTTEDGDFRYVYSDDDGESWSNPVSLKSLWDTEEYDYCIPSCTKGITLTNGTLVVPCFCKKGFDGSTAYSYPLILYKTVNGDWKFSRVVKTDIKHLDECAVVEGTSANSIWLYCRPNTNYGTGVNRGYNKFVYNINADTFTKIPTTFDTNRHNCFGIDRITIDGTVIYLMTFTDSNSLKRDNITLWASLDGDIWIRVYRILKQSGNGYSVIDNYNGQIWVAYESGDSIAVQDVSVLSSLISETASKYIVRNITVQDRMQMIYNALRGIN